MIRLFVLLPLVGLVAALSLSGAVITPVAAQTISPATQVACTDSNFFSFPTWDSCLRKKYGEIKITELNDVWLIVFPIIETILRAAGYIAVGFIIWGGIKYIKSQGEAKETAAARTTIQNALIGFIICLLSVVLVQFVAGRFSVV